MFKWIAHSRLSGFIGVLLLLAGPVVSAQDAETDRLRKSFREAFEKDDFAAIEAEHAALVKDDKRSARGLHLADIYNDLSKARECATLDAALATSKTEDARGKSSSCRGNFVAKLTAWRKAYPASSLTAVQDSEYLLGLARSVDRALPTYQAIQDAYLEMARAALEERVPQERRDSQWYLQRMRVATLKGWSSERFFKLLTQAVSHYPAHETLYRQAAIHNLPANGGAAADIEAVANLAAKVAPPEGQSMYAHVYDEVTFGEGRMGGSVSLKTEMNWPRMRAGLRDIYQRFPAPWNLNRFAAHACVALDYSTLNELFQKIGDKTVHTAGDGWLNGQLERCRELAARNPPQRPPTIDTSKTVARAHAATAPESLESR